MLEEEKKETTYGAMLSLLITGSQALVIASNTPSFYTILYGAVAFPLAILSITSAQEGISILKRDFYKCVSKRFKNDKKFAMGLLISPAMGAGASAALVGLKSLTV